MLKAWPLQITVLLKDVAQIKQQRKSPDQQQQQQQQTNKKQKEKEKKKKKDPMSQENNLHFKQLGCFRLLI